MDNTPNLTLPYILAAQAQKHVTHNDAIRKLDALVQLSVKVRNLSTPPSTPSDGDRFLVGSSPTGAWAGHAAAIAAWQDGAWALLSPRSGWLVWVEDEQILLAWNGTAWIAASGGGGGGGVSDHGGLTGLADDDHTQYHTDARGDARYSLTGHLHPGVYDPAGAAAAAVAAHATAANPHTLMGVNATADTTNRLSVNSPGVLFNHAGTSMQATLNKNAAANDAGFIFQTGFSTRALFGTLGSDDFGVKVSPNGSTFFDALTVARATGRTTVANGLVLNPVAADLASPVDGLCWYNSTTGKFRARQAGATVDLISAGGGSGDVEGPASATDNAVARFNLATGKVIQNSSVGISDAGEVALPEVPAPAVAGAGTVNLFASSVGQRRLLAFKGPAGLDHCVQPFLGRTRIGYFSPSGNSGATVSIIGLTSFTTTNFTATARNVATTNHFSRFRRIGYVTAATAGAVGNWRVAGQFTTGDGAGVGGFFYAVRFGISDAAAVSGARMFMGMRNNPAAANTEPSTHTQCAGIGHGAADTNFKVFYGGSAAQTPIDLGANFPCNTLSVDMYELCLFAPPNATTIGYQVTRLNTGHVASGTLTGTAGTQLPDANTLLGPWGFRTNNATALAVGLDVAMAYIENEY
jgi:hypothetical protein